MDDAFVLEHMRSGKVGLEMHDPAGGGPVISVRGLPMWHYLVMAAMAALAVELALLTIWKR